VAVQHDMAPKHTLVHDDGEQPDEPPGAGPPDEPDEVEGEELPHVPAVHVPPEAVQS
jgi:hypothetical protein